MASFIPIGLKRGLTPELTGAGGPTGPQGTNIGHQNREAMANVGVRVERFVRLGRGGRALQVHSDCVRLKWSQIWPAPGQVSIDYAFACELRHYLLDVECHCINSYSRIAQSS